MRAAPGKQQPRPCRRPKVLGSDPAGLPPPTAASQRVHGLQGPHTTEATPETDVTLLSSAQGCRFCRA